MFVYVGLGSQTYNDDDDDEDILSSRMSAYRKLEVRGGCNLGADAGKLRENM